MIERLPTPWGLVRLGVAPDHPKLKTVSRAFERIAEQPGFRFLGNVEVGRDLHHDDLVRLYDAVIYAVGAQTDRRLGIPGEDLPGSWAGHRVRGLVQRPPRLPADRVRPRGRAGRRDRRRERRARHRADARPHARGARADRRDRRLDRGHRELADPRDRRRRAARAGAGRVHDAGAAGDGRARRRRRRRRSGRPRGRGAEGHERRAQPRRAAGARGARAGGQAAPRRLPLLPVAGRDPRRGASRGRSSSSATSSTRTSAPCRRTSARRCRVRSGLPQRRLPRRRAARRRLRRERSGTIPNEGGRVGGRASTAPAGSSAARPA